MTERDDRILDHIGLNGVTLRHIVDEKFFGGNTSDHVINRLVKERRVRAEGGLPGGLSYYRLSVHEARARGFPDHRARPKKGAALRETIQVLVFCSSSEKKRTRLERADVAIHFGNGKGSGKPHCVEINGESSIVYRIYAPGPNSKDDYLLRTLRVDREVARRSPAIYEWIANGVFAFAVLVQTPERRDRVLKLVAKDGLDDTVRLVEVVPSLSTLAASFRNLQTERSNVVHD